jgi:hypothetical protein
MQDKIYKSPMKKLIKFFETSRNNWKKKYLQKKIELKRTTNRMYDLEKRKNDWKKRAIVAEKKLKKLEDDAPKNIKKNSPQRT